MLCLGSFCFGAELPPRRRVREECAAENLDGIGIICYDISNLEMVSGFCENSSFTIQS